VGAPVRKISVTVLESKTTGGAQRTNSDGQNCTNQWDADCIKTFIQGREERVAQIRDTGVLSAYKKCARGTNVVLGHVKRVVFFLVLSHQRFAFFSKKSCREFSPTTENKTQRKQN
jgi:hypothetical protein